MSKYNSSNQIGFNADLNKEDTLKVDKKENMKAFRRVIAGVAIFGVSVYMLGSFALGKSIDNKESRQEERMALVEESNKKKALEDKAWADKSQKQMAVSYVAEKSASTPIDIIEKFNKEMSMVEENKPFGSTFSVGTEGILLTVDVQKAMTHFGQTEEIVRLGISQGSDAYKSYLDRYKNLSGLNNSVLHIVDKHGKLIAEVK